jgi:transposase
MKRNENYPKYVQAMGMLDEGKSASYVCRVLHMDRHTLRLVRQKYLQGGELALLRPDYQPHLEPERKIEIIREITEKGVSLSEASLKYDILPQTIRRWRKAYEQRGGAGLSRQRSMKKRRQRTEAEMDEIEMLRKRNEYLEAENALLKKVKALVEEREARLRAIGQKPSKD